MAFSFAFKAFGLAAERFYKLFFFQWNQNAVPSKASKEEPTCADEDELELREERFEGVLPFPKTPALI